MVIHFDHGRSIQKIIKLPWLLSIKKQSCSHASHYCAKNHVIISGVISKSK